MPYLNSDDGFPDHPKVDALSDAAYRLHDAGRHYCAKHQSDGAIPELRVPRLSRAYAAKVLRELVDCGMWHRGGEGCNTATCIKGEADEYVVHDFLQWNKPRTWWEDKRRKDAERLADWRAKNADKNGDGMP